MERRRKEQWASYVNEMLRRAEEEDFTEDHNQIIEDTEAGFRDAVNGNIGNHEMEFNPGMPIETIVTDWEIIDMEVQEFIRTVESETNQN